MVREGAGFLGYCTKLSLLVSILANQRLFVVHAKELPPMDQVPIATAAASATIATPLISASYMLVNFS